MLLRHALKLEEEAASVERAVTAALSSGIRTRDLSSAATAHSCSAVAREIANSIAAINRPVLT